MPTYQYACTRCGHGFEAVQSFTDSALTECPECQGRLRKVFSSVGIVFKGSGFYRTDSRGTDSKDSKDGKDGTEKPDGAKEKVPAATGSAGGTDSPGAAEKKKDTPTGASPAGSGSGRTAAASGSSGGTSTSAGSAA